MKYAEFSYANNCVMWLHNEYQLELIYARKLFIALTVIIVLSGNPIYLQTAKQPLVLKGKPDFLLLMHTQNKVK